MIMIMNTFRATKFLIQFVCHSSLLLVTCPRLNNPLNGYVNSNSTAVLSRVTFSCHTGYELVGNNVTVCHNDSTWTNPIPQCKRKCNYMHGYTCT